MMHFSTSQRSMTRSIYNTLLNLSKIHDALNTDIPSKHIHDALTIEILSKQIDDALNIESMMRSLHLSENNTIVALILLSQSFQIYDALIFSVGQHYSCIFQALSSLQIHDVVMCDTMLFGVSLMHCDPHRFVI